MKKTKHILFKEQGDYLANARERSELNIRQIAERANLPWQKLNYCEKGQSFLESREAQRVAKVLDIDWKPLVPPDSVKRKKKSPAEAAEKRTRTRKKKEPDKTKPPVIDDSSIIYVNNVEFGADGTIILKSNQQELHFYLNDHVKGVLKRIL